MRSVTAGWAGASHQIDQRSRSADNGDDFTLLRSPHFLAIFMWKRALAKVCCTFCRSHLPKVLRPQVFFYILKCKATSCHSLVKKMPTSHLPKVLRTCICSQFGVKIELSLTVLCTFRRQLSQIEARNRGNRDPTSATPGATLPDKTQGFAPESVFTRVLTRDDMMLTRGLPDDDKTAPGHSSVTRKYSN